MHCAARSGQDRAMECLIDRGAPVSDRTVGGLTPLHMAVQGDHPECIKLLLNRDAQIDATTQVRQLTLSVIIKFCNLIKFNKKL